MREINYQDLEKNFKEFTDIFLNKCTKNIAISKIKGDEYSKVKEQIKYEVIINSRKILKNAYIKTIKENRYE